jgi:SPP1 family predicted phage head-tail adaptor
MTTAPTLNRIISIQDQNTTQDAFGQLQKTWTTVYHCWAEIDVQQSQLIYATAEFISKTTYRITIRWTSSVVFAPNMRIVYVDSATSVTHLYNIEAIINPKQGNFWLTFLAYELDGAE